MTGQNRHTPYHPRWYRRRVSVWWWLQSWPYAKSVLRELTSLFVAYYALVTLWKLRALAAGPQAYAGFLERMRSPLLIVLNSVALIFVLFHSITWFNLAPKAMVVRLAGRRLPDWAVQSANYLAWAIVSGVIVWVLRRG